MLTAVRTCCVGVKAAGYTVPSVDDVTIYVIIRLFMLAGGIILLSGEILVLLTVRQPQCKTDIWRKMSAAVDTTFR